MHRGRWRSQGCPVRVSCKGVHVPAHETSNTTAHDTRCLTGCRSLFISPAIAACRRPEPAYPSTGSKQPLGHSSHLTLPLRRKHSFRRVSATPFETPSVLIRPWAHRAISRKANPGAERQDAVWVEPKDVSPARHYTLFSFQRCGCGTLVLHHMVWLWFKILVFSPLK
jgi:hypothetical protein